MGYQKILYLLIGVIFVGIVYVTAKDYFTKEDRLGNRDVIIEEMSALGQDAFQHLMRPSAMGGGGGSYMSYAISSKSSWAANNPNAAYAITSRTPSQIVFTATSKLVPGATVTMTFDDKDHVVSGPTAAGF